MGRERKEIGQVSFVDVPTREQHTMEFDLEFGGTEPLHAMGGTWADGATDIPAGSVVRIIIHHRRGQEGSAVSVGRMAADLAWQAGAKFVRRPEFVVTQEAVNNKEQIAGQSVDVRPSDLFKQFAASLPAGQVPVGGIALVLETLSKVGDQAGSPAAVRLASIDRLEVSGFMAFGSGTDLRLGPGVYGISGSYAGEDGTSNRAGKSVLLDAVEVAAYGSSSRRIKNEKLVNDGESEAKVAMAFTLSDGRQYVIARKFKDGSQTASLTHDGRTEMRLKVVDARMAELLGVGQTDFVRTCFVRQGDLAGLLGEDNADARRSIARWVGLDVWEPVHKELKKQTDAVEAALLAAQNEVDRLVAEESNPPAGYKPNAAEVDELRRTADALAASIAAESERDKRAASLRTAIEGLTDELEEAEAVDVAALRAKLKTAERAWAAARTAEQEASTEVVKTKAAVGSGKGGEFSGMCPVDGCECPRTSEINADRRRIVAARKAYDNALAAQSKATDVVGTAGRDEQAARKALGSAEALVGRVAAIKAGLAKAKNELSEISGRGCCDEDREKLSALRLELDQAVRAGERMNMIKEGIARSAKQRDTKEQELNALRWATRATGRDGIVGTVMRESLSQIEGVTNDVLQRMGAPVRFEWSEDAQGRLSPLVLDDTGSRSLAQDSGGGRDLLAIGVRVALSRMLGSSVLFLDEVDGRLDEVNLQALAGMLRKLGEAGLRQVFVVSHRPEIAKGLERMIVVTRDRKLGKSKAVVV